MHRTINEVPLTTKPTNLLKWFVPFHSHLMFICVLYCPPNSDDSIYISLTETMDQLLFSHPNSLPHMWWLQLSSCQLAGCGYLSHLPWHFSKGLLRLIGLTQSVNFPTRISTNGIPSLLDLILRNFPENICCSSSALIGSSDHVLVKVDISLAVIREPPQRRRAWQLTQAN